MNTIQPMITPDQGSIHRRAYNDARKYGSIAEARLISVGGVIEKAEISLHTLNEADPATFVNKYTEDHEPFLLQYFSDQIGYLEEARDNDRTPLRRTELLACLARPIILLPDLLKINTCQAVEERKKLIADDGLYGLIGAILESSYNDLAEHDQDGLNESKQDVGLITELTALAMIDRPQTPSLVALPGLPGEDRLTKDDLKVYIGGRYLTTTEYQVKTNYNNLPASGSKKCRYISGTALGNGWDSTYWGGGHKLFRTTEAIISDLDGTATKEQETTLKLLSDAIRTATKAGSSFVSSNKR
jgi:hypothetical protein